MPKPPYIQQADGTVREGRTLAPTQLMPLAVVPPDLTFIRIDYQVRLQFGHTEVVIETPFTLVSNGEEHQLEPDHRAELGPVLALYPNVLRELGVLDGGGLRLTFESGASMRVPPHPRYEAWQVVGPGTRMVVCAPGGARLDVWEEQQAAPPSSNAPTRAPYLRVSPPGALPPGDTPAVERRPNP